MNKYNYEELKAKLNRCSNMKISDVNPDDGDKLSAIKLNRIKTKGERIYIKKSN